MEKEYEYNNMQIEKMEKLLENLTNSIRKRTIEFYKIHSKKEKKARILKNISKIILGTSIITLLILLMIMSLGTINIPLDIATVLLIFAGLDMYKDAKEKRIENKEFKEKFNLDIKEYEEEIQKYEDILEVRNILKEYLKVNFIADVDKETIKEKIENIQNKFTLNELEIFNKIIDDKQVEEIVKDKLKNDINRKTNTLNFSIEKLRQFNELLKDYNTKEKQKIKK